MNKLFTLAFALLSLQSFAQSDSRTGYIIVTSDTLRGAIVYREGIAATQVCSFRKEGAPETRTYGPLDIKAYGFESRHFIAVVYNGDVQFMEVIVRGTASLLRSNKTYFLSKDSEFVELKSEKKQTMINGARYDSEDKAWLGRAKPLFADCPSIAPMLDGIQLTELSVPQVERKFSKVITTYNTCRGEKPKVYAMTKEKSSFSWGVFGGLSIPHGKFKTAGSAEAFFGSPSAAFGLSMDYANRRLSEKFRLHVEVSYAKTGYETSTDFASSTEIVTLTYRLNYSTIKVPLMVHYSFTTRTISPFLRGGISANVLRNGKFTQEFMGVTREPFELSTFNLPLVVGAGLEGKMGKNSRWFIEGRYETQSSLYMNNKDNLLKCGAINGLVGVRF